MIEEIIQTEIKKFITESYVMKDDRFNFKQRLNNSSFHNYSSFSSDYDTDIIESDVEISWGISFWLNGFGVENFIVDINEIKGTFKLEFINRQTDEHENDAMKNINDVEWKFVIGDTPTLVKGQALYITDLDFDFKTNICRIGF